MAMPSWLCASAPDRCTAKHMPVPDGARNTAFPKADQQGCRDLPVLCQPTDNQVPSSARRNAMSTSQCAALVALVASSIGLAGTLFAQSATPVGHVHYMSPQQQASPTGALAPRLQNLGSHTFPVSTRSAAAQRFINQGLNLAYAFNHAEARRAFREAARLDPDLAMAYWGQALVLGPNINAQMEPNEEPHAFELVQQAMSLRSTATPRERAYIEALAERYSGKAEDRRPRDQAYSAAMKRLYERFPDDLDAATLYVESMMDLRPWGYWQRDG